MDSFTQSGVPPASDLERWAGLLAMKTKEELINSSSRADTAILSIALTRLYGKRQLGQIRHPL